MSNRQQSLGSMGPGEPTDSMGPRSYRIGIRVGAKDVQEARVTPWGQGCQTSYLVHEARGMAAIKQWFVCFLQHRAANFHRISGAQALQRDNLVFTCSKFSSVPIK